ncbi:hypothetical protein PGIGA_G00063110 [Pangasianodon gigas]|uniref:Uncharacterized protein n=1 Tax=Pangasianodon gigas TaxID=30993 RepID=A0ACC5X5K9_PANGG|nr:hypothetical protein [Pangasianodon gigas]
MSWVYSQISSVWLLLCLTVCPCRSITVKGISGQNVTLPCKYDFRYHGKCEICWMRGEIPMTGCGNEIIATDGDKVVRRTSRRYRLDGELQKGDASLTIHGTTQKDSGRYGCRVHVPGWFNDEKIIVDLVIIKGPSTTTEVNSLLPSPPELVTPDPFDPTYTETTHVSSTRHYSNDSTAEANKTGQEPTDDMLPVTVVSILLIFLIFGTAIYLICEYINLTISTNIVLSTLI